LSPTWDVKEIYNDYIYRTSNTKQLLEIYVNLVQRCISDFHLNSRDIVLDIGSGDGSLLAMFSDQGIAGIGIDPNSKFLVEEEIRNTKFIESFFEDLTNIDLEKLAKVNFRLIFCNFTLANSSNLNKFLQNLYKIGTSKTNYIVITGYHPDQLEKLMFDYISHDHLNYFTVESFSNLINKNGFKLDKFEFIDIRGGCVLFNFTKGTPNNSIIEKEALFNDQFLLEKFNQFKSEISELDNFLSRLKDEQKVYGIGAATSSSYLLSYLETKSIQKIDAVFDDDIKKIGKFIPYYGLEVKNLLTLSETNKIIVLFSWQHTKLILKRLKKINFLGQIIIPLPKFQVINSISDYL
jgi:ubiquinone/menaquinone biosynthesis C-methylase UbiE